MDNEATKPKRRRLGLKLLFAVSLALNLAVLGAVAGAVWRHGGLTERDGVVRSGGPAMLRALSPEDRRAVFRAARAAGPETAPEGVPVTDRLVDVLRAEPLDTASLSELAAAQRQRSGARLTAISEAWQARVIAMSPQARAAYADRLERLSARRPGPPPDD